MTSCRKCKISILEGFLFVCFVRGERFALIFQTDISRGFPGGSVVKNPPANAGDMGSVPNSGRSHMP